MHQKYISTIISSQFKQTIKHPSHTMKPSDPLLLADVTLRCGMYPAGKVDISQHLHSQLKYFNVQHVHHDEDGVSKIL